ncbi:hypothetical protein [Flavobacterium caeni]|uniref:Uncharacterized protein n=1 Tax=Flavobacterium caeni TaxID=490189 RepID=A0A1G5IZ07_9FLAO|nr:hypothetical protein [Flavobacterium caeni]SCY80839.1 hypothetical protein SAMN02927903_02459 [Flavobacterium caeni]
MKFSTFNLALCYFPFLGAVNLAMTAVHGSLGAFDFVGMGVALLPFFGNKKLLLSYGMLGMVFGLVILGVCLNAHVTQHTTRPLLDFAMGYVLATTMLWASYRLVAKALHRDALTFRLP